MTTLMTLRRAVRQRVGVPMTDDFFTDDVIDDVINQAIEAVESEQRWPWQEHVDEVTVTVDNPDIPLEENWRATRAVFTGADELLLVSPTDLLGWVGPETAGQPQIWTVMADRVVVAPQPAGDIALTHFWYSQPAILHHDDDMPEMPTVFTGSIVAKASELLSQRENDATSASVHLSDYTAWIARMRRDLRRSTGPLRVRVRSGSWI